jgi:hypothetical protein
MAPETRIRLAYELGRLRLGALRALWVVPLALIALALNADRGTVLLLGIAAQLLTIGFTWQGGPWARAIFPGLLAGGIPLLLPLVVLLVQGHDCAACAPSGILMSLCVGACVVGGLSGGALVGWLARGDLRFALASGTLAAVIGAMGCSTVGYVGMIGAAAGLVIGGGPLFFVRPASR